MTVRRPSPRLGRRSTHRNGCVSNIVCTRRPLRRDSPNSLGWDDDGDTPILALEDLSGAHWPPPWGRHHIEAILAALSRIKQTTPPDGTPKLEESQMAGWFDVAADPTPFLGLGLCSRDWLDHALPALLDAEKSAPMAGNDFLHQDIRSDNL